jgi:hypothetical protein
MNVIKQIDINIIAGSPTIPIRHNLIARSHTNLRERQYFQQFIPQMSFSLLFLESSEGKMRVH